ncbi:MAG TPA: YceI family protein [Ktedonobacterales bacterium]|nr:YceI family protein [Ktedonobacterales bacterium]
MAWQLDTAHSELAFAVKHMMVSTVRGRFRTFGAEIDLNEKRAGDSRVDVTIDLASVDTGNEMRDNHLRSADFFDVAKYPTATFVSKRVEERGEGEYHVIGDLSLHGVTRETPLTVTAEGPHRDMQSQRRLGFTITGTINRKDFDLNYNAALEAGGWVVGDTVKLQIEVEALEPATVATTA